MYRSFIVMVLSFVLPFTAGCGNGEGDESLIDVTSVTPGSGLGLGGTLVTILGKGFVDFNAGTNTVTFSGVAATELTVVDDSMLTCKTPAGAAGAVDVVVTNGNGAGTLPGGFTYYATCAWDPEFGDSVSASDDSSTERALLHGFEFFEVAHSSVFIGSNGVLSFTAGISTFMPNIPDDIQDGLPKIMPGWRDLNATNAASDGIYFKTDEDKSVVTFNEVNCFSGCGLNSFQVHLFATGRFCIVYNGMSASGQSVPLPVGNVPGGGASAATVDLSEGGAHDMGGCFEVFDAGNLLDLDPGVVDFVPDGAGGYSWEFYPLP